MLDQIEIRRISESFDREYVSNCQISSRQLESIKENVVLHIDDLEIDLAQNLNLR